MNGAPLDVAPFILVLSRWVGCFSFASVPCVLGFDLDAALFAGEVMAVARPWPVFRSFDETSVDWVAVDVFQLLGVLLMGEDVEVVVADLPELLAVTFEALGGFGLENVDC